MRHCRLLPVGLPFFLIRSIYANAISLSSLLVPINFAFPLGLVAVDISVFFIRVSSDHESVHTCKNISLEIVIQFIFIFKHGNICNINYKLMLYFNKINY